MQKLPVLWTEQKVALKKTTTQIFPQITFVLKFQTWKLFSSRSGLKYFYCVQVEFPAFKHSGFWEKPFLGLESFWNSCIFITYKEIIIAIVVKMVAVIICKCYLTWGNILQFSSVLQFRFRSLKCIWSWEDPNIVFFVVQSASIYCYSENLLFEPLVTIDIYYTFILCYLKAAGI